MYIFKSFRYRFSARWQRLQLQFLHVACKNNIGACACNQPCCGNSAPEWCLPKLLTRLSLVPSEAGRTCAFAPMVHNEPVWMPTDRLSGTREQKVAQARACLQVCLHACEFDCAIACRLACLQTGARICTKPTSGSGVFENRCHCNCPACFKGSTSLIMLCQKLTSNSGMPPRAFTPMVHNEPVWVPAD